MIAPAPTRDRQRQAFLDSLQPQARDIHLAIRKAGALWDRELMPLRDSAVWLCNIDQTLADHHVMLDGRTGKLATATEPCIQEALLEANRNPQPAFLQPHAVLDLNQNMCELNQDYGQLLHQILPQNEFTTTPKEQIRDHLQMMRQKVDIVYAEANKIIGLMTAKAEELIETVTQAVANLDKFFTGKDLPAEYSAIQDLCYFMARLIVRQPSDLVELTQQENFVLGMNRRICDQWLNPLFKGVLTTHERDIIENQREELIHTEIPKAINDHLAKFRAGIEAWYTQAKLSYAEALAPYL